jgi:hypothetical protein
MTLPNSHIRQIAPNAKNLEKPQYNKDDYDDIDEFNHLRINYWSRICIDEPQQYTDYE